MTDDLVKRYRNSREWLNDGECCGDKDSDGVCAAPACIFGEAVKELQNAADRIEKLEASGVEWQTICDSYAAENQRFSDRIEMMSVQLLIRSDLIEKLRSEIEELKEIKYNLADKLYLATRRTDDNGDLLE